MNDRQRSWVAPLVGVVVGIGVFVAVNVGTGRAIVPTVASMTGATLATADFALLPGGPAPVTPYQAACGVCHQPEGQGLPFAFPPLAGSSWMTGDPETPIRIVLLGLSGPIEVNGSSFNLVMPPPPGLDDAKIAEVITYARTNFGNAASPVDVALVKKVRDSLGGRTAPWTAAELTALRTGAVTNGGVAAPAGASTEAAGSTSVDAEAAAPGRKKRRATTGSGAARAR
jgi:mono/diheme cytochrome c family protein